MKYILYNYSDHLLFAWFYSYTIYLIDGTKGHSMRLIKKTLPDFDFFSLIVCLIVLDFSPWYTLLHIWQSDTSDDIIVTELVH